jgi:hypothetical protein
VYVTSAFQIRTETDAVFETLCFIEYPIKEKVKKKKNSEPR